MAETTIPVEFLFSLTATTAPPTVVQNGPQGNRMAVSVTGGSFEGPRLKGSVVPNSGADWVTIRPDGSFKLDVRLVLQTDDGAAILMYYTGIGVRQEGGAILRTAPLFETGDERYAWLNRIQAVGLGRPGTGTVSYDIYALSH